MKVINRTTGEVVADVTTNRSMSIDEVIGLMNWKVDENGDVFDEDKNFDLFIGCYDDLGIEY